MTYTWGTLPLASNIRSENKLVPTIPKMQSAKTMRITVLDTPIAQLITVSMRSRSCRKRLQ